MDLKIAYIGGGSRGWAWGLMSDLALEPALSGTVALYDINLRPPKLTSKSATGCKSIPRPSAAGVTKQWRRCRKR